MFTLVLISAAVLGAVVVVVHEVRSWRGKGRRVSVNAFFDSAGPGGDGTVWHPTPTPDDPGPHL